MVPHRSVGFLMYMVSITLKAWSKMLSTKTIYATAVMAIFLISIALAPGILTSAAAQAASDEQGTTTEKLLELLDNAKERVQQVFAGLEERGVPIPEAARQHLAQGLAKADEAVQLHTQGDLNATNQRALEAMGELFAAVTAGNGRLIAAQNQEQQQAANATGVLRAVERAEDFRNRLLEMAETAAYRGYNTTEIDLSLATAGDLLQEARTLLNQTDVDGAVKALGEARGIMGPTVGELKRILNAEKTAKAARFLDQAAKRLEKIEERIVKIDLPPRAQEAITAALQKARQRILEAKDRLARGEVNSAIDSMEEAAEDEDQGINEIEETSPRIAKELKETAKLGAKLNRLEAKLHRAEAKLQQLERKGVDVAEASGIVAEVESLIQSASQQLKDGDGEAAEDTIETADELLEELEESLKDSKKALKTRLKITEEEEEDEEEEEED
ncbi:MAG: hypothetical protein ACE5PO_06765 [Candidatus Bathyarchaeia archaeon]